MSSISRDEQQLCGASRTRDEKLLLSAQSKPNIFISFFSFSKNAQIYKVSAAIE
jgi:hypothetical protein